MWAVTRAVAATVPPQCLRFYYTSIYERAQQWRVYPRGRQVCVLSFPRGGTHVIGSVTDLDDPLQRIRTGQTARVPILLGGMEDDGTIFVYGSPESPTALLASRFGSLASSITPDKIQALYPGLNDSQALAAVDRDVVFRWCVYSFP